MSIGTIKIFDKVQVFCHRIITILYVTYLIKCSCSLIISSNISPEFNSFNINLRDILHSIDINIISNHIEFIICILRIIYINIFTISNDLSIYLFPGSSIIFIDKTLSFIIIIPEFCSYKINPSCSFGYKAVIYSDLFSWII